MLPYAPGARVVIRDEEWLVRRVDPSSDGGHLLSCDGVSELVRGRAAQFLTELEDEIKVLDPAKTELVADTSSNFNSTFLYLEAQLRRSTPNDDQIHLGHRAVMNLVPYQLDPALQALKQPRQRILIADSTGLGKTLEAGILTTELIQRGRGQRILVVALKSMLTQFQKEFWSRFSIPFVRLSSPHPSARPCGCSWSHSRGRLHSNSDASPGLFEVQCSRPLAECLRYGDRWRPSHS